MAPAALRWRPPPRVARPIKGISVIDVAASIVHAPDGRVLLAERTADQISAGFWELPGGKIDAGETAREAAERELQEEVGIVPLSMQPWIAYEHTFPTKRVRLQFFRVDAWKGEPRGLEGQRMAWVDPTAPSVAPILPSNVRVLLAFGLSPIYFVVQPRNDVERQSFLAQLPALLARGIQLLQIRDPYTSSDQRIAFARRVNAIARPFAARILLTGSALEARRAGLIGIHSTAHELRRLSERPPVQLWAAACHDAADLARAVSLGADLAVVSPVLPASAHPHRPLGWDGLQRLTQTAPIPVFAQGGMTPAHLEQARRAGAAGVATSFIDTFFLGGEHAR
jgi:8-oxo-dGTP diphosphatase